MGRRRRRWRSSMGFHHGDAFEPNRFADRTECEGSNRFSNFLRYGHWSELRFCWIDFRNIHSIGSFDHYLLQCHLARSAGSHFNNAVKQRIGSAFLVPRNVGEYRRDAFHSNGSSIGIESEGSFGISDIHRNGNSTHRVRSPSFVFRGRGVF